MSKATKPSISIGIPVFNQSATIADAIVSAINQSTGLHEVVVSDNHSTDGTLEIIRSFGDKIRLVQPRHHLSMADNWNFCARSTTGTWFGLCSGDDRISSEYIATFQNAIANQQVGFAMGGWLNRNEVSRRAEPRYLLSMKTITKPMDAAKMLLTGPKASFASFCVRRDCFEKVGGYDNSFQLIQDWILQFDLAVSGVSFLRINKIVAEYRIAHRPLIDRQRQQLYVRDLLHFLESKIWEANSVGVDNYHIDVSSRYCFNRILYYSPPENYSTDDFNRLQELSIRLDCEKLYAIWLSGDLKKEAQPRSSIFRSVIRKAMTLALQFKNISFFKNIG